MVNNVVMDGKLVIQQKSFYHVNDLPEFARNKVLQEAIRQMEAASSVGYTVEWLIFDPKAITQLTDFFKSKKHCYQVLSGIEWGEYRGNISGGQA